MPAWIVLEFFYGQYSFKGDRRGTHFSVGDLKSMGYHFCDTLLDFCDPDQTKVLYFSCLIQCCESYSAIKTKIWFKMLLIVFFRLNIV